ncbi:hypothetical protein CSOJ01_11495 [Colletotrichum sojae]|uniref:Uncharacterized protein n=1 Tax=Colletotrichum sojae TaxID=2175907 RepID=A0A8H6MNL4_9PEZI|nr:hypothetical protein CSOJ01_11495 [Colletotrichum sojae]
MGLNHDLRRDSRHPTISPPRPRSHETAVLPNSEGIVTWPTKSRSLVPSSSPARYNLAAHRRPPRQITGPIDNPLALPRRHKTMPKRSSTSGPGLCPMDEPLSFGGPARGCTFPRDSDRKPDVVTFYRKALPDADAWDFELLLHAEVAFLGTPGPYRALALYQSRFGLGSSDSTFFNELLKQYPRVGKGEATINEASGSTTGALPLLSLPVPAVPRPALPTSKARPTRSSPHAKSSVRTGGPVVLRAVNAGSSPHVWSPTNASPTDAHRRRPRQPRALHADAAPNSPSIGAIAEGTTNLKPTTLEKPICSRNVLVPGILWCSMVPRTVAATRARSRRPCLEHAKQSFPTASKPAASIPLPSLVRTIQPNNLSSRERNRVLRIPSSHGEHYMPVMMDGGSQTWPLHLMRRLRLTGVGSLFPRGPFYALPFCVEQESEVVEQAEDGATSQVCGSWGGDGADDSPALETVLHRAGVHTAHTAALRSLARISRDFCLKPLRDRASLGRPFQDREGRVSSLLAQALPARPLEEWPRTALLPARRTPVALCETGRTMSRMNEVPQKTGTSRYSVALPTKDPHLSSLGCGDQASSPQEVVWQVPICLNRSLASPPTALHVAQQRVAHEPTTNYLGPQVRPLHSRRASFPSHLPPRPELTDIRGARAAMEAKKQLVKLSQGLRQEAALRGTDDYHVQAALRTLYKASANEILQTLKPAQSNTRKLHALLAVVRYCAGQCNEAAIRVFGPSAPEETISAIKERLNAGPTKPVRIILLPDDAKTRQTTFAIAHMITEPPGDRNVDETLPASLIPLLREVHKNLSDPRIGSYSSWDSKYVYWSISIHPDHRYIYTFDAPRSTTVTADQHATRRKEFCT